MALPSFTTIDKAIVTALGFVVTVGGLVAQYGGVIHLPAGWLAIAALLVGGATTLLTYLQPNAKSGQRQVKRAAKKAAKKKPTPPTA